MPVARRLRKLRRPAPAAFQTVIEGGGALLATSVLIDTCRQAAKRLPIQAIALNAARRCSRCSLALSSVLSLSV